MCQWTGSAMVQVTSCHLFGTKPWPESMLPIGALGTNFSEIRNQNTQFISYEMHLKTHLHPPMRMLLAMFPVSLRLAGAIDVDKSDCLVVIFSGAKFLLMSIDAYTSETKPHDGIWFVRLHFYELIVLETQYNAFVDWTQPVSLNESLLTHCGQRCCVIPYKTKQ